MQSTAHLTGTISRSRNVMAQSQAIPQATKTRPWLAHWPPTTQNTGNEDICVKKGQPMAVDGGGSGGAWALQPVAKPTE